MNVLALDTATAATVVAVTGGAEPVVLRDDPPAGARPGHARELLPLARGALERAALRFADLDRVVAGTGPGSFTGLRIGLATARALALAAGAELAGVSTLRALAAAAEAEPAGAPVGVPVAEAASASIVAPVLDARRGEVFVAAWRDAEEVLAPRAAAPEQVAAAVGGAALAVGDGALRFRELLEPAGLRVPPDGSPLHRVDPLVLARLGAGAVPAERTTVLPEYLRLPDAELALRARTPS